MTYRMYDNRNNFVMNLSYKPTPLELIKNDETDVSYTVVDINHDKKFCKAQRIWVD